MAIACPSKNSPNYRALEKRVGERLAHVIWHQTNGQISINGWPLLVETVRFADVVNEKLATSRFEDAVAKYQDNKPTDPTVREKIFNGKDTASAKSVLLNIKKQNPSLARLVDGLLTAMVSTDLNVEINLVPVNTLPTASDISARGQYDSNTNSIDIAEFGHFNNNPNGFAHNSILHEVIHAITHNYIYNNPASRNVVHLKRILDKVTGTIMQKEGLTKAETITKYYGLTDISEFISEGLVNGKLAKEMLTIPSIDEKKYDNIFKEVYDWIITVVNSLGSRLRGDNIYKEFLGTSSEIMIRRKKELDYFLENELTYYPTGEESSGHILYDISMEKALEIKNSDNDYLVRTSAGDVLSTSEEDAAIGSIMTSFSNELLSGGENISVDKVVASAKQNLLAKRNQFAEAYNDDATSDEDAEVLDSQISSVERIVDATAWEKLTKIAIDKMASVGVTVSNGKASDNIKSSESDINPSEDQSYDSSDIIETGNEVKLGEDWSNAAMFSVGDMDTSSRAIKMMMWSLRDPSKNTIGLAQVIDPSTAYQRVLNITSVSKSRSLNGLIEAIDEEATRLDKDIPNNMFRQLYDKLKASDLQTRIQFVVAMNRNRNTFIGDSWTSGYKILSPFSSESKNANKIVYSEWKSFVSMAMNKSKDIKVLFSQAANHIAMARDYIKDNPKQSLEVKRINAIKHLKEAFKTIGIELSANTYSQLGISETYVPANGYTFRGKATFESQFSVLPNGGANGVFSALEQAFNGITNGMSIDDVFAKLDESAFSFLATIESKSSNKYFANTSTGIDGNTHYNFGIHTAQTRTIFKLLNDSTFLSNIKNSIFKRNASWLKDENLGEPNTAFRDVFKVSYHFGIRKAGTTKATARKAMALSEDLLCRLSDYQNNGKNVTYLWDTAKSDKANSSIWETLRISLGKGIIIGDGDKISINKANLINSQIMSDAFGIVNGEADRMVELMLMDSDKKKKLRNEYGKNYHANGQFFYNYTFLNKILSFDENLDINPKALIDVNGKKVETSTLLSFKNTDGSVNEEYINFFKDKLADYFIQKVEDDIQAWKDNGLVTTEKGKVISIPINEEYAKKNKLTDNKIKALKHLALEFNMNSQIAIHNSVMLISGDFAQMEKPTKNNIRAIQKRMRSQGVEDVDNLSVILGIDKSLPEYQKRLAKDIAPMINVASDITLSTGEVLSSQYNVIFTDDMRTDGEEYKKSLAKGLNLSADQLSSKGSDASELVSLENKLESLLRYGIISEKDFLSIRTKYRSGKDLSKADLKKIIIGVGKPLQVMTGFVNIGNSTFSKETYIKSSEMPLIRQITETINGPLDELRKSMESHKISRVVHLTAAKIGAEKTVNIYDANNNIRPEAELNELFKTSAVPLDWEGFGYQQDMPYAEDHKDISFVTQADKLLFDGLLDAEFDYKGEKVKGSDLVERKHSILTELTDIEDANLDATLGYSDNKVDEEKALAELEKVAPGLKWQPSDVQSVRLAIKNKVPLMMTAISSKMESVYYAMYNRVIKKKQPGGSAAQEPLLGKGKHRATAEEINNIEGVIKTSAYNVEKGLVYSSSHDSKVTFMDIMMPFKFWNNNELLDIKKFVDENGILDSTKVPDEFLKIVGMRIPNQGHSSQVMMRVVGFLPQWYGDTVLVPPAITTQMGSDFDIDKLYMYWRNSFQNSEGKITKIPSNIIEFDSENDLMVDRYALEDWRYSTFRTKFENKKNFYSRLHEIQQLDKEATEFLNKVKESKSEEGASKNDINAFSEYEITFDEAKQMALADLGMTMDDIAVPSVDSLIKKALQDSYFELFETVLSDKDVIRKAMTPLDRNDLVDLAEEVQSYDTKLMFSDPMRQALDYMAQSGAKSGVSIFSKVVPTLSTMDNMDVHFIGEEGELDMFSKFADHKGRKLELYKINPQSKSKYIDPVGVENSRTAIENEIILQTGSVDNANKPVLDKNNLNTKTFGVAAVLCPMSDKNNNGISLNSITRFLRQEGIKKLAAKLFEASSTTATYEESVNRSVNEAVQSIINDYKAMYSKGDEKRLNELESHVEALADMAYSPMDLLDLEQSTDKTSLEYIGAQIDMLNMYQELDRRAWLFSDATSMATLDSNGMDINYWENQNLLYRVSKAMESGRLANASKIWSRDGSMKITMNKGIYSTEMDANDKITASGRNVQVATKATTAIGHLLGYDNPFLRGVINYIETIKGLTGDAVTKTMSKNRKTVANAFKSFIYSKLPLIGDASLGQLTNGSLANELLELKKDPNLTSNLYVQTLQTDIDLKYIQMNAMVVDNSAASNMTRGFYELAISDNHRYRDFAENMVKYELLMGGIQSSSSSLKYIAPDILEKLGFHKDVLTVMKVSLTDDNIEEFTEKFFQNNPDQAVFIKDVKSTDGKVIFKANQEAEDFTDADKLIYNKLASEDTEGYIEFKKYFRTLLKGGKPALYRLLNTSEDVDTVSYEQIPLRGSLAVDKRGVPNFSDYSQVYVDVVVPSVADDNVVIKTTPEAKVANVQSADRMMENVPNGSVVSDVTELFKQSDSDALVWTGGIIDAMKDTLSTIKIVYAKSSKNDAAAEYNHSTKVITIFKKQMSNGMDSINDNYAYETLAHEINHAIQHEAYLLGKNGDPKFKQIYDNVNSIFADAKEGVKSLPIINNTTGQIVMIQTENGEAKELLYSDYLDRISSAKDKIAEIGKIANEVYPNIDDTASRNDLRLSLYSFSSAEEFIADINSRPKLQQLMRTVMVSDKTANQIGVKDKRSVLRAFLDQFAKLFTKLNSVSIIDSNGLESSQNSVLEASFINSMLLIDKMKNETPIVNELPSPDTLAEGESPFSIAMEAPLGSTISEFLRGSEKDVRFAFRNALSKGLFNTKCD